LPMSCQVRLTMSCCRFPANRSAAQIKQSLRRRTSPTPTCPPSMP
jgi:hypothetical protein